MADDVARAVVRRAHAHELCAGHFPGDPLVPGAYLTGLMAELAALYVQRTRPRARLVAIEEAGFARRVVPDEPIVIECRAPRGDDDPLRADAVVYSAGVRAARARLRFGEPS